MSEEMPDLEEAMAIFYFLCNQLPGYGPKVKKVIKSHIAKQAERIAELEDRCAALRREARTGRARP